MYYGNKYNENFMIKYLLGFPLAVWHLCTACVDQRNTESFLKHTNDNKIMYTTSK